MFIMAEARAFDKTAKRIVTVSPVKAHLYDGSVVVFPEGVRTKGNVLKGDGIRYDLTRQSSLRVRSVERDSVAFMESYEGKILPGPTFVSIAGIGVSTIFLLVVALATATTIRGAME
jgi:1-acyl-sn-glycerol-3-phosphate acyltransferase